MTSTDTQIADLGRHASAHLGDTLLALNAIVRDSQQQTERLITLSKAIADRKATIDEQVANGETFDVRLDNALTHITETALRTLNTSVLVNRVETVITSANRAATAATTARALSAHV